jgi:hypothetical protein
MVIPVLSPGSNVPRILARKVLGFGFKRTQNEKLSRPDNLARTKIVYI